MDRFAIEVFRVGGEKLLKSIHKEFDKFFIVARTPEYIVVGDGSKNVSFSRKTFRAIERHYFDNTRKLERKR